MTKTRERKERREGRDMGERERQTGKEGGSEERKEGGEMRERERERGRRRGGKHEEEEQE